MKNNIKYFVLAAVVTASLTSVNASAATYNAGVVIAGTTYSQAFGYGAAGGGPDASKYGSPATIHYSDTIEFELTAPSYIIVFAKNLSPGFDFEMNAGVSVIDLKDANGNYILRNPDHLELNPDLNGSYNFFYPNAYYFPGTSAWGEAGSRPDLTAGLPKGKYSVNFNYGPNVTALQRGTFTGGVTITSAAAVTGDAAIATIPEPETYAMMLAGLALIGFLARRRKI
ncbi:MAG: FxDxF family PEP-CTERM protein [Methylotenera sp.]